MAGVIPKKSASGRKQWTLHGGPRSSLKRLRSQLASDGCPESQVVLAKQLLYEDCEFKSEQKENARLGVYWLIKASEQGNIEATELLKTCLHTGKGINEQNFLDVKSCISMTQDEKVVRRAAKEMFASLSNGGEYITSNQLQKKILEIDRGEPSCSKSTETKDPESVSQDLPNGDIIDHQHTFENYDVSESEEETDWSQKPDAIIEKLTEDNVVSAAVSFSRGNLPTVNNVLCLTPPNLRELDHIPYVYRSILHPWLSIKILYFKFIRFLGRKAVQYLHPFAKSEVQLIIFLLLYAMFNSQNLLYFVPTLVFYCTFVVMIVSTFQMLQTSRELHDFKLWAGLFICYSNGGLNEQPFETQFLFNHTKPYFWYFVSLLLHYFCYAITPTTNKFESEFTVISCCVTFMTLLGFMPKRRSKTVFDSLVLLSFAVNVLARYPYDTDPIVSKGWRYLELNIPSFPSYIVGNGIEFCINFRLVLYAVIPLLLVRMAMQENWRGSYKIVLPHLVTLSWLQYFALCSHNATTYGLYRATLALVGSVFFLPLVGLTSVILPVVALTKWIVTSNIVYTICSFVFLVVLSLGISYLCAKTRYAKYTAVIQIIMMFVAFFVLLNAHGHRGQYQNIEVANDGPEKSIEWHAFQKLCRNPAWEKSGNLATVQTKCAELEGNRVYWDGYVVEVRLNSVTNSYKDFFDRIPVGSLRDYLYCLYGDKIESECEEDSNYNFCSGANDAKCSLKTYNVYSFEAKVKMQSGIWGKSSDISLILDHYFQNFTLKLQPKDHVWFKGSLFNDETLGSQGILGGEVPHVNAEEIGCIVCLDSDLSEMKIRDESGNVANFASRFQQGFKFILNVMFNPILSFK